MLVTTVQAGGGGVMVWGMFSWHTLGPLLPIGHRLKVQICMNVISRRSLKSLRLYKKRDIWMQCSGIQTFLRVQICLGTTLNDR